MMRGGAPKTCKRETGVLVVTAVFFCVSLPPVPGLGLALSWESILLLFRAGHGGTNRLDGALMFFFVGGNNNTRRAVEVRAGF